jgi:hypothetical protein
MRFARNRRRDVRSYCRGQVHFSVENSSAQTPAEMVDVSSNGFRLRHSLRDLEPGREVRFEHRIFFGRARVMWTTLVGGRTESGFLIIRG